MPLINILPKKKIKDYEEPPVFSAQQRKYFLTMPASIGAKVNSFPSSSNQGGFQLMFGYFLAQKRFYSPDQFREKDISFLCKRLGLMSFGFDAKSYRKSTYTRHKAMILEYFAFKPFETSTHGKLLSQAVEAQIYSWEDHALIFEFMLEWLEFRRIERPSYHSFQTILTRAIRDRNKKTREKFDKLLQPKHKEQLDKLLKKQGEEGKEVYLLTSLHSLSPSDTPKQIKKNLEKLQIIQTVFDSIKPLMEAMSFTDNAIRYLGEFVSCSKSSNINRRDPIERYLYLAAFCMYQRSIFEDWMGRTLLMVCKSALNKASRKEKDRLFQERKQQRKAFVKLATIAHSKSNLLIQIRDLAWLEISPKEKEKRLQALLPQDQMEDHDELEQITQNQTRGYDDPYYEYLAEQSQALQQRASPIIKNLSFNDKNSDKDLLAAIKYFRDKDGVISKSAPTEFLSSEDKKALLNKEGRFKVSLYKMLLFQETIEAINRGSLNLKYSYKYKAVDDYLIPQDIWDKDEDKLLEKANLSHLKDVENRFNDYKKMIAHHFTRTNTRILKGGNSHFRKSKRGNYHIRTPKSEKEETSDTSLFPSQAFVPLSEVLATVDQLTNFLSKFRHLQPMYRKQRPDKSVFFAGITAFGCNLGIQAMAKAALPLSAAQLENTANWYFNLKNLNQANTAISNFTAKLPLANLHVKEKGKLRTSSDGQKIKVISEDTIYATYSTKYFNKGKGVSAYSFVDERYIPFYSVIIDATIREATYVLDGLLHNDAIKSTIHVTDTHGFTEALFGVMDLLGFGFSPNIAKLYDQTLYTFKEQKIAQYAQKGYPLLPKAYINEKLIRDNWNEILRVLVSLKLKYCTASQVFKRLNSYSKQHPLYAALKEYGRMVKTLHVLRFTDDLEMRQEGRKSANAIESSNRLSSAVFFANGGEMIFLTRPEQQIAEACKRLIKNSIICWNYLYLTRKIQRAHNPEHLIEAAKETTANAWKHLYFNGTYDFSNENLADSFNLIHSQNYELGFA
ncbi:MAG: Tn3 family transposase [Bacteroidia bacterium]|nr:Tn3 family transposase [Bacteroidia bacterium]